MKSEKSLVYSITSFFALPIYSLLVNTKIEGEHFIVKDGPVIIVSNHISFIDPLALCYLLRRRKRQVTFLAKDSLFKNRLLGWFFRQCQQIPVSRETDNAKNSLIHANEALNIGKCVAIYPEGTISDTNNLLAIKSGALRLAQSSGAEIVVIGTYGANKIWTKGSRPNFKLRSKHAMIVSKGYKIDKDANIEEEKIKLANRMSSLALQARKKLGE